MRVSRLLAIAGIAVAGITGASLRWATNELVNDPLVALLILNSAGAFILGILLRTHQAHSSIRLCLGVGFCGSLTTFSTLTAEVAERINHGQITNAFGFTAITIGVGLIAIIGGRRLGTVLEGAGS